MALMIIKVHPDLTKDPGYSCTSTFEPAADKTVFDLAQEWSDAEVLAAISAGRR